MTTASRIDIENRIELAAIELLKALTGLVALTGATRIYARNDTSHAAGYPAAAVQALAFAEYGNRTGWYRGALQVSAQTYRDDDKSKAVMKQILGELRGWAQQTDLPTQFNATTSAKTAATALDVRDAWLDGGSFDASEGNVNEMVLSVGMLCRPTQATTT